ncbi:MAG: glycosyltransferase family 4 protein [Verrucomicrobia bacterium]|nr:glycosyltransferase family 4 protein [Verrucomicrobiota bacterium]
MNARFPEKWSGLKVVLCHDWLTGMRGGERVLDILCRAFPEAPVYTLFHNPALVSAAINSHKIVSSRLRYLPGITRIYRWLLPMFPAAVEAMDPPAADLLISTSHCVAKGLKPKAGTKHLCYCFTPMRYAWTFFDEYFGGNPVKTAAANMVLPGLRKWDAETSKRVDRFVGISRHVVKRIKDYYGRDADVVYPPVDTEAWTPGNCAPDSYDLLVSALVPYKRIDLAVNAYTKMGFPLKVVGSGSGMARLRAVAGANIEFLGWRADEELLELYRSCRMLVFPGEEDFGIVPLEAQACGRPVVAYARGGALETIVEGQTGVFFQEQTEAALTEAVNRAAAVKWDPARISAHAGQFSVQNFVDGLARSIDECMDGKSR